jgi:hypothetical protein
MPQVKSDRNRQAQAWGPGKPLRRRKSGRLKGMDGRVRTWEAVAAWPRTPRLNRESCFPFFARIRHPVAARSPFVGALAERNELTAAIKNTLGVSRVIFASFAGFQWWFSPPQPAVENYECRDH